MSKYITIKDIANELGISKSTVSRALSGDASNVKAETMKLITETARRMGYQRNELAVSLRKQSSHNIAIIIPEIVTTFYMTSSTMRRPYCASMATTCSSLRLTRTPNRSA